MSNPSNDPPAPPRAATAAAVAAATTSISTMSTPPWLAPHGLWSPTPSPCLSHVTPTQRAATAPATSASSSPAHTNTPLRQVGLSQTPPQAARSPLPLPPPHPSAAHTRSVQEAPARAESSAGHPRSAPRRADSAREQINDANARGGSSDVHGEDTPRAVSTTVAGADVGRAEQAQMPATSASLSSPSPTSSSASASSSSSSSSSASGSPRSSSIPPAPPHEHRRRTHTSAAGGTTTTTWTGCGHSDLPARCRDTPGYYCTYCSYTVCADCVHLIGDTTDVANGADAEVEAGPREKEFRAGESVYDGVAATAAAPRSDDMDWLDAVLAAPPTAVRSGTDEDAARVHRGGGPRSAVDLAAMPPADLACHLCRRGQLVREEALLHEWCCEGPAPAARRHGGAHLVYDTAVLHKYHYMRGQRQARLTSTQPLIAQVLRVAPCASLARRQTPRGTPAHVTQAPDARGGRTNRPLRPARDPMPTPDGPRGRPAVSLAERGRHRTTGIPAPASAAQLDRCEEGGSFVFSVWNPRTEVPLVWCAVNLAAREDAAAFHQPARDAGVSWPATSTGTAGAASPAAAMTAIDYNRNNNSSSSGGVSAGGGRVAHTRRGDGSASGALHGAALPSSATVTPLFTWRCPPSLPGLPARPYRVHVPYGAYAFQHTHALALYVAADIFRKSSSQLAASLTGGSAMTAIPSASSSYDGVHAPQLSSVKISPAATLRALLVVRVLHHIVRAPRPLALVSPVPEATTSSPSPLPPASMRSATLGAEEPKTGTAETSSSRKRARDDDDDECSDVDDAVPPSTLDGTASGSGGDVHRTHDGVDTAEADVQWPAGLASPELALCVDHLLHGRSVAVYGIASKFFFLQHVAQSAALRRHMHVVSIDATLGRPRGVAHVNAVAAPVDERGGVAGGFADSADAVLRQRRRTTQLDGGVVPAAAAAPAPPASVLRQLVALGHLLVKRAASGSLDAAAAAAAASATRASKGDGDAAADRSHYGPPRADARSARHGAATDSAALRAALTADEVRSPAVAREATAARVLRAQAPAHASSLSSSCSPTLAPTPRTSAAARALAFERHTPARAVDVVNVDAPSTSCPAAPSDDEMDNERDANADVCDGAVAATSPTQLGNRVDGSDTDGGGGGGGGGGITPARAEVRELWPQPSSSRAAPAAAARTPLSQHRAAHASSSSSSPLLLLPPLMSPVPAFFDVLQRTVSGAGDAKERRRDDAGDDDGVDADPRRVVLTEMPALARPSLASLRPLPPIAFPPPPSTSAAAASPPPVADTAVEVSWCAPAIRCADDGVRRAVLRDVRRRDRRRRCVQWASLPSTSAMAVLSEQSMPSTASAASPTLLLTSAHAVRPGWRPPVLLVLHNVDLLDSEEAGLLGRLCAEFALPHPQLQLLVSFDDPRWPLTPLAAGLERIGVCAVQLRSLLLPRVHEMQSVNSVHLLTESEAVAAGGPGGNGGGGGGGGAARALGPSTSIAAAGGGGGSHLLQDTMRRVLFSLPPAFGVLLRILIDTQEELGEGQRISLFVAHERFEQHGLMVTQGRQKALLQELTSNRIAHYDMAEHALVILQPRKLRKVLEEVTAQRDAAAAAAAAAAAGTTAVSTREP